MYSILETLNRGTIENFVEPPLNKFRTEVEEDVEQVYAKKAAAFREGLYEVAQGQRLKMFFGALAHHYDELHLKQKEKLHSCKVLIVAVYLSIVCSYAILTP